jgi:hypothetical protein
MLEASRNYAGRWLCLICMCLTLERSKKCCNSEHPNHARPK